MYYKYFPDERLSYFSDELIRFTQPGDLNDPFECLPEKPSKQEIQLLVVEVAKNFVGKPNMKKIGNDRFLEIIQGHIDDIENEKPGNILDKIYNSAKENNNKRIGIFSLSKNWNNILMWAHYSVSHKGFCVGFEPNHPFFKDYISEDGEKSFVTREVKYAERIKIPMKIGLPKLGLEPFITKSLHWEYEEEVRMIGSLNLATKVIESEPFPICLFKVPHEAVSEVILGTNISDNSCKLILDFCKEKNIPCFHAEISSSNYNMERTDKYCL